MDARIELGTDDYQFGLTDAGAGASVNRVWSPFITPYTVVDGITPTTIALKDRTWRLHMATCWYDGTGGKGREGINCELALVMPDNQHVAIAKREILGMGNWPMVNHYPGGLPLRWPIVLITWMPSGIVDQCWCHIRTVWSWEPERER